MAQSSVPMMRCASECGAKEYILVRIGSPGGSDTVAMTHREPSEKGGVTKIQHGGAYMEK